MPLYQVAPTRQLPHTIDLIQRQSAPRFANEVERDQQYPDPEVGALSVVNTTVEVFNGTGWIAVGGGQPTRINNLQDVDARFPPDGAVLTWSSAAQAWGWSMPATTEPPTCIWGDDFERADGPVGSNWVLGPATDGFGSDDPQLATIDSGAAVGPPTGAVGSFMSMNWATPIEAADQFIEVVLDNWVSSSSVYMRLVLHNFASDGLDRRTAQFRTNYATPNVDVWASTWLTDGNSTDGDNVDLSPWGGGSGPVTFRLDSYGDGRQVVTLNGAVVLDFTEPSTALDPTEYSQGMTLTWTAAGGRTAPRVLSVTGGCLE